MSRERFFLIALGVAMAILIWIVHAALITSRIGNVGYVKTVGVSVFQDAECRSPLIFLDWGYIEPSTAVNRSIYIRNDGNVPITLTLQAENPDPSNLFYYVTVTWNYNGLSIPANEVVKVELVLAVQPNIGEANITRFSFDIIIIGTG